MRAKKYTKVNPERLAQKLNAAKGVNGVRSLIQEYLSPDFRFALTLKSPEFFLLYYLGFKLPEHQRNWILLWMIKYLLELAPRDHGKSWIFSYGLPLYEIYASFIRSGLKSVDARFLQIAKTDEQASKYGGQVRQTIEDNVWLARDFGDIRDMREWLKGYFRCKRTGTDSLEKDYTYEKVGVLGAITGGHFHRVGGDDILDDENTKNVERMDAIENWFWGTVWNLRESYTKYTMVGTRKNRRDLYNTLIQSPLWKTNAERAIIKYPMIPDPEKPGQMKQGWQYITDSDRIIDHPNQLRSEEKVVDVKLLTDDYKVLWPSTPLVDNDGRAVVDPDSGKPVLFGWGIKELLLDRAAQGSIYFDREKQNEISAAEGAIFNRSWFSFFDTNQLYFNPEDGYVYLEGAQ